MDIASGHDSPQHHPGGGVWGDAMMDKDLADIPASSGIEVRGDQQAPGAFWITCKTGEGRA